jgi:hypothetical protein
MATRQTAETARRGRVRQLAAPNRAALAIADDLDLDRVLTRILSTARSLVRARYGGLGVPDGRAPSRARCGAGRARDDRGT